MNKGSRYLIYVSLLLLVCVCPMMVNFFSYSKKKVVVDRENLQYVSLKNQEVSQEFYLEGELKKFSVLFFAPSGELYLDSEIEITIQQEDKVFRDKVKTKKIKVKSPYDRSKDYSYEEENKLQYALYPLDVSGCDFHEGKAVLYVSGDAIPDGTDIFCLVSSTVISGLPSARTQNGDLGYPLVVEYDVVKHNQFYFYDWGMLVLLLISIFVISWFFVKEGVKQNKYLYIIAVWLNFIMISIQTPTATFFAEPRSEAIYEFWYKAHTMKFGENLMSLMSGESLVWTERVLMWFADLIMPEEHVFLFAQIMEGIIISLICAMPCLKTFEKYYSNFALE